MKIEDLKKKMRLGLAALLAFAFSLSASGCGDNEKEDDFVIPNERPPATAGRK